MAVGAFDGPTFVAELRRVLGRHPAADRFVYFGSAPVTGVLPTGVPESGVMAVGGVRPTDTCKEVVAGFVRRTVPRERLIELKGPWFCTRETIELAIDRVNDDAARITNPHDLCRASGLRLQVFVS